MPDTPKRPDPILVAWAEALLAHQHPICSGTFIDKHNAYCAEGLLCDVHPEFQVKTTDGIKHFVCDFKTPHGRVFIDSDTAEILPMTLYASLFDADRYDPRLQGIRNIYAENDRATMLDRYNHLADTLGLPEDDRPTDSYFHAWSDYFIFHKGDSYEFTAHLPKEFPTSRAELTHEKAAALIVSTWMKIHNQDTPHPDFPAIKKELLSA